VSPASRNRLVSTLLKPGVGWPEVAKILRRVAGDPEAVRQRVLRSAAKRLLKDDRRAFQVVEAFRDSFRDGGEAARVDSKAQVYSPFGSCIHLLPAHALGSRAW
jgi:hypothetical protein